MSGLVVGGKPPGLDDLLVREIMTAAPVSIGEDESFMAAWERMTARGVHHLPVTDRDGRYRGMVDATRLAATWPGGGPEQAHRPVSVLLRDRRFPRVRVGDPVRTVAAAMVAARADAVAVTAAGGHLAGIVTVRDLLIAFTRGGAAGREQRPDGVRRGPGAAYHPGSRPPRP